MEQTSTVHLEIHLTVPLMENWKYYITPKKLNTKMTEKSQKNWIPPSKINDWLRKNQRGDYGFKCWDLKANWKEIHRIVYVNIEYAHPLLLWHWQSKNTPVLLLTFWFLEGAFTITWWWLLITLYVFWWFIWVLCFRYYFRLFSFQVSIGLKTRFISVQTLCSIHWWSIFSVNPNQRNFRFFFFFFFFQ